MREVHGRAALETLDKSNEILDYESSKPMFEKWSQEISDATGGKSLGNLRVMHGKTAAGKLTAITFNDLEKAIDVVAKVVDDDEWNKVMEGVYTGFSVGGSYAKRWKDPEIAGATRYTASPTELSLVDNPAIPGATFSLVKADGMEVECQFQVIGDPAMAKAVKGEYGPEDEAGYADPGYQEDEKPRYPLKENGKWSEERIRAAWGFIHHKQSEEVYTRKEIREIEKRIIHAWKEEIDPAGPPSNAEGDGAQKMAHNPQVAVASTNSGDTPVADPILKKGMYDVAQLSVLVQELAMMQESAVWESKVEGDKSKIPNKLKTAVRNMVTILKDMLAEETAELLNDPETPNPDPMQNAAPVILKKGFDLEDKAGLVQLQAQLETLLVDAPVAKAADSALTELAGGLEKAMGTMASTMEKMAARLAALEAEPKAPVGALNTLGKSADTATGVTPVAMPTVKDHYGQEHASATLIKSVHATGGRPLIHG